MAVQFDPRALARSPFARLTDLLAGRQPGKQPIDLTIGEPRHGVPAFVGPVLARNIDGFGRYPPIRGTPEFRAAIIGWLKQRYSLDGEFCDELAVLPLNGSREGLFFAAIEAARNVTGIDNPLIMLPNPFFQTYAAAVQVAGARVRLLDCGADRGFLPDPDAVDAENLSDVIAVYLASPANPQGAVIDLDQWSKWLALAQAHDFLLVADECYSEIYRHRAPPGLLEAAARSGHGPGNLLVLNSLSKRSNLPGLRCGFAAGAADFIERWARFRNMAAPQVPLPVQQVAIAAYGDEDHVRRNRELYNLKYQAADALLGNRFGYSTPQGGFFLWLDISQFGTSENLAVELWENSGLRVIPGSYLAGTGADGINPGDTYIRLAMVADLATTEQALSRLVSAYG